MIKNFIDKLLSKTASLGRQTNPLGKRQDVPVSAHGIDLNLVNQHAVEVVQTLKQAGFEAYIVGGAVRDLLLGLRPKDFDVATSATPEQVKSLFRRAFIIGRRFRIVHVVFGRGRDHEVIEVSTFRAYLDHALADQVAGNERTSKGQLAGMKHAIDASGRVLRDNVWGPIEHDAARRDFSINAMYYDPQSQVVVDFHHGIRDAKNHTLRIIGEAATRYREDPVRIIRAVRFAAKLNTLGFKIEAKTLKPLLASRALLAQVPQSRLFDEMLKLLQTGHALASVAQLKAMGLEAGIYPLLDVVVQRAQDPLVNLALQNGDLRVQQGKPVSTSFLLACVLWADVLKGWQERLPQQGGDPLPPIVALQEAVDEVFEARIGDVSGRGKLGSDMREIWMMQPRFDKRTGTSPTSLVNQARFRSGFDFLWLRAQVGEVPEELAHWWETFEQASQERRADMIDAQRREKLTPPKNGSSRRRTKRPETKEASTAPESPSADAPSPLAQVMPSPARRARSRRQTPPHAAAESQTSDSHSHPPSGARFGSPFVPDSSSDASPNVVPDSPSRADDAAPKKRRRRRKPTDHTPGRASPPSTD